MHFQTVYETDRSGVTIFSLFNLSGNLRRQEGRPEGHRRRSDQGHQGPADEGVPEVHLRAVQRRHAAPHEVLSELIT